jgi:Flp pilus assembly protein TadD
VDTSKGADYSIVNPKRLSTDLQNNICQRCHLQGVSVLNDGKTYFDFRPGMQLSEVMNVFMPQYEGAEDKMIMASHVERMKKSHCYVSSGKMSCITCHKPHVSVKFTPESQYTDACKSCHGGVQQVHCSEKETVRAAKNDNCVTCHMLKNGSIDIPHVAVTDHYIRKRPVNNREQDKIRAFLGLQCFNNDKTDAITKARAYMEFFERFNPNKGLLDSALYYLNLEQAAEQQSKQNRDYIRLYFLKEDFDKVVGYASALKSEAVNDGWAAYRAAESYSKAGQLPLALSWYKRATELMPYSLDFQNKYANCLLVSGNTDEAKKIFEYVLSENPLFINTNINLGYLYMQQGNSTMAYSLMQQARQLAPDAEQNLINLAIWYHNNKQDDLAKSNLLQLLKRHPENEQAKAMLDDLGG